MREEGDQPDGPMISAWAPGRVVLIGDYTDHSDGLSIAMATDLGTSVTGQKGGRRIRLHSTEFGDTADLDLDASEDDVDGRPDWSRFVCSARRSMLVETGLRGRIESSLPVGSGMSSSAALSLSLALALGFDGTPIELAKLGQAIEQHATGVPCGLLDQLAGAFGQDGHALLIDFADNAVEPLAMPDDIDVVVTHSGESRRLDLSPYAQRLADLDVATASIGPLRDATASDVESIADATIRKRARHVSTECIRVRAAATALGRSDAELLGKLMIASHQSLRDDLEVSTPALNDTVERMLRVPGILGARLTGAGFGGCVVAICERGAVPDPSSITGRGWLVRASGPAALRGPHGWIPPSQTSSPEATNP